MAKKPKTAALDAALAKRRERANALFDATLKNAPDLVQGAGPGALDVLGKAYGVGRDYVQSRTPQQVAGDVAKGLGAVGDATARYAKDRAQHPLKVLGDAYGVTKDIVTAVPQAVSDVAHMSERAQALKATDPAAARRMQAGIAMAALGAVPGVRTSKKVAKAVDEAEKLAAKHGSDFSPTPDILKQITLDLEASHAKHDIRQDVAGVIARSHSSVDRNADLDKMHKEFAPTRDLLRSKYGDNVTLYRAETPKDRQIDGVKTVRMASKDLASKFTSDDRPLGSFTVPVEDIVGAYATNRGDDYHEFLVRNPASAAKEAEKLAAKYADPESSRIADWQWRPQEDVKAELGLSEVPPHVADFGRFMDEQASRATKGQMTPRDLLKAYGITRSSMQRSALSLPTAQKRGLDLEHLGLEKVRPEGAFSELLGTPEGQAYLDAAQRGQVNDKAINDMMAKFRPYGFQNALGKDLRWAASNLPQHNSQVSDMVAAAREGASNPEDWTRFVKDQILGVDAAKAGFVGAMLGRGDLPTFDARQIILQTGKPTEKADKYLRRKKGEGSVEAVKRLTARMKDLNLALPPELEPYRQHLTHHTVWDKASDEMTTHADVMNALKGYAKGGLAEKYGL